MTLPETCTQILVRGISTMTRKYSVIDADGHVLEPLDLWTRYIDPKFRDRAPRLIPTPDGREVFHVDAEFSVSFGKMPNGFATLGSVGMRDGESSKGDSYTDGRAGGFDPHKRIPDMDSEGIDAAFLYPSLGLNLGGIRDSNVSTATFRAYNRWLADYCSPYPDRLFGVAMIPLQSVEDAVEEIKFASKTLGFRGGFIRPNPYNGKPLHNPDNDPVWRIAQELDFSIGLHGGNSDDRMPAWVEDRYTEGYSAKHCTKHTLQMIAAITSFVMSGICERFPKLKVGFLESGGGWVAGWLDRMDRHFEDKGLNDTILTAPPSEIFRRQCFISFEPVERTLPLLADYVGRTNILWATDYPHADGFVNAPQMIRNLGLSPAVLTDVLATGAKRFYGLEQTAA